MIIMGRLLVIMGIWAAGFFLGFIGYIVYPVLSQIITSFLPSLINLDSQITSALVTGIISSVITLIAVLIWAYSTRSTNTL